MTLQSGERQVAPTIDGIRRDHVARYEFAARRLPEQSRLFDYAAGICYGARILAEAGHHVTAFDIDEEALEYGREHYAHSRVQPCQVSKMIPPMWAVDAAVCFETVEHLEDPRSLLKALRDSAPLLIASVPNEAVFPYAGQRFHFRHYTKAEFECLLNECGWHVKEWHGQLGDESDVVAGLETGRTLIAVAERGEPKAVTPPPRGKHVAILGLGPSVTQFLELTKRMGGRSAFCDEVWTINALGDVFATDLVFHMDDVRVQAIRALANPQSNIARMLGWLKTSPVPVVTSRAHEDFPALQEFPLQEILSLHPTGYFNSTAAYTIAYAVWRQHAHRDIAKISIFGMDFTYPNAHDAEKGRACVEFWLGIAVSAGIQLSMPKTTSLMDALAPQAERFYGYDTLDLAISRSIDGVTVTKTPRPEDKWPTAEEVELAYDHSAHPNALVREA
jgi:hypothetical protein